MNINNFIEKTGKGLYCKAGDFYIDPKRSTETALVSHAHGDHAVPSRGKVYCTAPTKSFMDYRHGKKSYADFIIVEYSEPFYINEVRISFHPAGHILGSAQIKMEYQQETYLYTGDFKTQPDESCENFEFIECDHLITETTFASPEYFHPDPSEELIQLFSEHNKIIAGAYSLGKAQRLTQLISKYCPEVSVYIHPDLEPYHLLYHHHGYPTGTWKTFRRGDFDDNEKCIYVVPPSQLGRYSSNFHVLKVFATGWKRSFYRCDRVLRLSDHADWPGVLEMIIKTKAKKVYTVHGNGEFLKDHLKDQIEVKLID